MKSLLKYEFRKTWMAKLIVLGITAVAELAFLIGLALENNDKTGNNLLMISIPLLMMIAMFGVIFIGIQSVLTLHRDMNTKQGYMLYMTPRNSYQILGAKFLENGLSIVLASAVFFLLGMLDVSLLFGKYGELDRLWDIVNQMLKTLNSQIDLNAGAFLVLTVSMLASWLATVAMAYLADIVSSALLNGKKMNMLITFILFILLSVLMNWLQYRFQGQNISVSDMLLIRAGIAFLYSVVMYFLSAYMMDHYLSV